jgi:hypothetical protein
MLHERALIRAARDAPSNDRSLQLSPLVRGEIRVKVLRQSRLSLLVHHQQESTSRKEFPIVRRRQSFDVASSVRVARDLSRRTPSRAHRIVMAPRRRARVAH